MPLGTPRDALGNLRTTILALHGDGRGWMLLAVATGWFFVLGMRFVIPAVLPAITTDFPVSNATAGAAITLLWITYALMQFPSGALVDRFGERRLLVASIAISVVGLIGYVVSATFALFLLATTIFGLGTGIYGPARGTVITRTFPDRDGTAFGATFAAGSIGAATLPALAAVLATVVGWRLTLGLAIPGFLVVGVALWRRVPTGVAGSTPQPDGGTATVRAQLGALRSAIGTRPIALATVGNTLMLFGFQGLTAFLTTYLVEAKGLSEGTAGLLFGLMFLTGALCQSLGGGLADRIGSNRMLAGASFASVVPLVALPLLDGTIVLALVSMLIGVRMSVPPVTNAYVISRLPVDVRGSAWGLLRAAFFLLGSWASIVVGAMADRALFGEAFILMAAVSALAGVAYLFLPARDARPA